MKKTFALFISLLSFTLSANAQFEAGKSYIGPALTGINLQYNGSSKFQFGVSTEMGYFAWDEVMLLGRIGWNHKETSNAYNAFNIGAGTRYYIRQNGIFLGASLNYVHRSEHRVYHYNDFVPAVEVGYSFFVSRDITLEPALYYEQSTYDHSNYSTIGLKLGLGIYMHKDKVKNAIVDAFQ